MSAAARLATFVRLLRREGYAVGVQETLDGLRTVSFTEPLNAELIRAGLRSLVCRDLEEWRRFDALFDRFWLPGKEPPASERSAAEMLDPRLRKPQAGRGGVTGLAHAMAEDAETLLADPDQGGGGAGRQNTLSRADFRFLTDRRDQRALERLAERLALRIRRRLTRRRREVARGTRIHLRRTLRRSLPSGGLPRDLRYLERRREPPRLIFIQDVSHSMASYSPLLTRFVRGLLRVFADAEAYSFHVKLHRVTPLYRETDVVSLRRRMEGMNQLWMGGTRIADSLARFNDQYAGRVLNGRCIVVILSDGFDSDRPEELVAALDGLRSRARRLLWLNPMLGRPGACAEEEFSPELLERLDYVGAAHSLAALGEAANYLARA